MMAAFIAYTIAITVLSALSGHLLERCCVSLTKPSRGVWFACLLMAVLGPLAVISGTSVASRNPLPVTTSVAPLATDPSIPENFSFEGTASSQAQASLRALDPLLGWAWLAASLVLAVGLAVFTTRARRIVRNATPSTVCGTPVLLTDDVGPAIVGAFHYEILLPRWVVALPAKQKELVLAHENEHAKAFDPLLLWLAAVTVVLFPWNGGLWYIMRRLRTSIEFDCDRRVLKSEVDAHAYMTLLVDVVERVSLRPSFATALTESPSQLQRRISAMTSLSRGLSRTRTLSLTAGACILLAAAVRIPLPSSPMQERAMFAQTKGSQFARPAAGSSNAFDDAQDTATRVYLEYEVTQPASPVPETGKPVYPASLRAAKVQGEVLAKFVVSVTGKVEMNTVKIEKSSNDLFAAAVRSALSDVRFEPARLRETKVRQLVEQAFMFQLRGAKPEVYHSLIEQNFQQHTRPIRDSAAVLARKLEPAAFDRRANPGSWLIGLLFDKDGRVIHHSRVAVQDDLRDWTVYYPRLFPDAEKAQNAPYGLMADLDKGPGKRIVGVVAAYLADPRKK